MKQRFYAEGNLGPVGPVCRVAVLAAVCVLFTVGCPKEEESGHTDPSFLVGTWSSDIASFTIAADYTFVCDLVELPSAGPGRVKGKLNYASKNLGPNDYIMVGLTAGANGEPDDSYTPGNTMLRGALPGFDNLLATFTPSADKKQFTFQTATPAAQVFFGGTYSKK
jgi:hypothetical protein